MFEPRVRGIHLCVLVGLQNKERNRFKGSRGIHQLPKEVPHEVCPGGDFPSRLIAKIRGRFFSKREGMVATRERQQRRSKQAQECGSFKDNMKNKGTNDLNRKLTRRIEIESSSNVGRRHRPPAYKVSRTVFTKAASFYLIRTSFV